MRFLVDAQLPPALARWLAAAGHEAEHVADLGLAGASDLEVWDCALGTSAVIVSKDEDFVILRSIRTPSPPIVWIRRGNTSRRELLRWIEPLFPQILAALRKGEDLVEVI